MSEQLMECALCGRDVDQRPPDGCDICHGNAEVLPRAYTLSDVHAGRAPKEDRYGDDGGLNPKTSPLVVGGSVNHPYHRQN